MTVYNLEHTVVDFTHISSAQALDEIIATCGIKSVRRYLEENYPENETEAYKGFVTRPEPNTDRPTSRPPLTN